MPNYPGQEKYFKGCAKKCLFIALVPTQGTLFKMKKTRTNNFIKLFSMVKGPYMPFSFVLSSVCRFKSLSYYRHLAASPLFGGQIAEAQRAAGASYLPSKRWRCR